MGRDDQTDAGRMGAPSQDLDSLMGGELDLAPRTLAEEKRADPEAPGTASDYAGLTTDIHRRELDKSDPDEPLWTPKG